MAMADGTNVPCVKKDMKGVRGKNGDEAHSRQLRVMNFFEYCNVDGKGTPVPIRGGVLLRRDGRGDRGGDGAPEGPGRRARLRHGAAHAVRRRRGGGA